MNVEQVATELLNNVGGSNNIKSNANCMTRLRLGLKNPELANIEKLKKIDGVLCVVEADTFFLSEA